jgi:hypothetical protein
MTSVYHSALLGCSAWSWLIDPSHYDRTPTLSDQVAACTRWVRRSHHWRAWRLRSSRSVKRTLGQKLCLTTPMLRSTLPLVCGV